jgi:hypothetical protein
MSSLSPKDRVSLCMFTFSDGRRCRTPRAAKHPRFCFYHAQKEARARTAKKLGKDLAYFFSGDYLSACDLSTALARLIPAVVRGDVKPRTARTVAYLAQTLLQAIHISQHEYCEAFDTDDWRKAIRNSVNSNHDYRFPPDPEPEQSESLQPQPQPAQPQTQAQQPATATPSNPPQPTAQPAETPVNCHSERSEEPAFSASRADHSPLVTHRLPLPQAEGSSPLPPAELPATAHHLAPHPVRNERCSLDHAAPAISETHSIPATPFTRSAALAAQPDIPPRTRPSTPPHAPNRDVYALHFDHNCRLRIDGKPF